MELCLAADVKNMRELVYLINQVGEHISILKLHIELIEDFYYNFNDNCKIPSRIQIAEEMINRNCLRKIY